MSIEELMAASEQVYSGRSSSDSSDGSSRTSSDRRRHPSGHNDTTIQSKLDNITRMMERGAPLSPVPQGMQPIFSGGYLLVNHVMMKIMLVIIRLGNQFSTK